MQENAKIYAKFSVGTSYKLAPNVIKLRDNMLKTKSMCSHIANRSFATLRMTRAF